MLVGKINKYIHTYIVFTLLVKIKTKVQFSLYKGGDRGLELDSTTDF